MANNRLANLDLLRIISMFFIVLGHCILYGAMGFDAPYIDFQSVPIVVNWVILYVVVYLIAVGVNCFVMLSGYLLAECTSYRWKSIIKTWFVTFAYSAGICLIFYCLGKASAAELISSFFPIYSEQYWFMTTFIGLSLISPFLSKLVSVLEKRDYIILLIILSFLNLRLFKFPYGGIFGGQYSLMWFTYLFIVGAFVRKYEPFKNFHHFGKSYLIFGVLLSSSYMCYNLILYHIKGTPVSYAGTFYNSFTFVTSLFLFLWAVYLRLPDNALSKVITRMAPCMFGVYLISEHNKLRYVIWDGIIRIRGMYDSPWLIPLILASSITVFVVCLLIDKVRIALFKVAHIQ